MSGKLKIKIEGLTSSKIINALIDENILLENIHYRVKFVIFEILAQDEKVLKLICKKFHKKYLILSKNNFVNFLRKCRYYFGFTIAIMLVSIFAFWLNLYIYQVKVSVDGVAQCDLERIKAILKDNKIVSGMRKKDLEINEIEKLILSSQNDVAGCSVNQIGGILNIVIYPGLLKEEISKENIYSKYDAIITDIQIYSGKTKLKVGDLVKTGDLLIENDNGAKGKIKGKVYFSDYIIYNENQVVKVKTGRINFATMISFFNKIPHKTTKNISFINYLEENCAFCISKNTFLPISLVKIKYEEFEYQDVIIPFADVENNLKENLYKEVIKQVSDISLIRNVSYSVVTENNMTRLDCFVECEMDLI